MQIRAGGPSGGDIDSPQLLDQFIGRDGAALLQGPVAMASVGARLALAA